MCLYPRLITNPKYKPNKKNNYRPPVCEDERVKYVPIGCGRCMECTKQKARSWQVRLLEDIKYNTNAHFTTLTLSDEAFTHLAAEFPDLEGYALDNAVATLAMRRFLERWRKKFKKSVRHWFVTELGHQGTENVHLHGLLWTDESEETVSQIWGYGKTHRGSYVNEQTINYIVKYVYKVDIDHKYYKPRVLTSAGIGAAFTTSLDARLCRYRGKHTREVHIDRAGLKRSLPIYYRNKIYNEKEREALWLHRLDRNERFVCGIKCKANDTKTYLNLLKHFRELNKRLGYGDDEKDWSELQYEEARRSLLHARRKQNAHTNAVEYTYQDVRRAVIRKTQRYNRNTI